MALPGCLERLLQENIYPLAKRDTALAWRTKILEDEFVQQIWVAYKASPSWVFVWRASPFKAPIYNPQSRSFYSPEPLF